MSAQESKSDIDVLQEIIEDYHTDELSRLTQGYPEDKPNFRLSLSAVRRRDEELFTEFLLAMEDLKEATELAVKRANRTPVDLGEMDTTGDITIQVVDLPDEHVYTPSELRSEHANRYVGIEGTLGRVTSAADKPEQLVYECKQCGAANNAHEQADGWKEPGKCKDCERKGPYRLWDSMCEWMDFVKIRVDERLEDAAQMQGDVLIGEIEGNLQAFGGQRELAEHTGDDVVVYGTIRRRQKTGRNADTRTFDRYLEVEAVEYQDEAADIDIAAHREEFEEYAARNDAVDLFADSIAPQIYPTEAHDLAAKVGVAYLFAPPRINPPNGPSYRGDIHVFLSGDPGQAKSVFMNSLAELSPKVVVGSATTSSEVGLTASAVQDEFGGGEWTLKPGMLVRANGGHAIIDEIDKGPDDLEKINDALEGEQQISVEKAGMNATLKTRCGVMSAGNPEAGHFKTEESVASQLDIAPSLLDRFDAIVVIKDQIDEERDRNLASHMGASWQEAVEMERGNGSAADTTERPVPKEVARAWVAAAQRRQPPRLTDEAIDMLADHFVEVRELNGEDAEVPPATPRKMEFGIRFSMAFALTRLSDTVDAVDVEQTIDVSKRLMSLNWDTNTKQFDGYRNTSAVVKDHTSDEDEDTQESNVDEIWNAINDAEGHLSPDEIQERVDVPENKVEHYLEKLSQQGDVYQPKTGEYEAV